MPNLSERFAQAKQLPTPQMWEEVQRRASDPSALDAPVAPRRSVERVVAAVVAFGVFGVAAFLLLASYGPGTTSQPHHLPNVPSVTVSRGSTLDFSALGGLVAAEEAYGSLWIGAITRDGATEVLRADRQTGSIEHTFPVEGWSPNEWGGNGIVIGAGKVWIPGRLNGAILYRVDPSTDSVDVLRPSAASIAFLAFGQDGTMWANIGQRDGGDAIAQLDPATGEILKSWPFSADWSHEICSTQGTVWVHEASVKNSNVEGGWMSQVVPGTAKTVQTGGTLAGQVCDSRGVWAPVYGDATAMNMANGIALIDPTTGATVDAWPTDPVGYDVAVGTDGGVWFLTTGKPRLERLNPSTGATDVTEMIDGTPIFVLPNGDHVWVGTYEGQLIRFDISVSSSATTEVIPQLVGLTASDATSLLKSYGLQPNIRREAAADPVGTVFRQSPAPGTTVPAGTVVDVRVSDGLPGDYLGPLDCPSGQRSAVVVYPEIALVPRSGTESIPDLIRRTFSGIQGGDQLSVAPTEAGDKVSISRDGAIVAYAFLAPHLNEWELSAFASCTTSGVQPPSR